MIDEMANLDPQERGEVAVTLRRLSETLAEVSDGKTTSHVLGVLARLLDPARPHKRPLYRNRSIAGHALLTRRRLSFPMTRCPESMSRISSVP